MRKSIVLLLISLLQASLLMAQTFDVIKHIGIENGLSNNFISDIALDKQNTLWVATESGLNCIMGNTVTNVFDDKHQNLIGRNEVRSLFYHRETDKMLIGAGMGLSVYDFESGTLRNFTKKDGLGASGVNSITMATDGGVWLFFSNGSVQHMNCENYEMKGLKQKESLPNRCGFEDKNGKLYLGHIHDGLSIIDLKSNHREHYAHDPNDSLSLPGNLVRCIYQDRLNNIWVGTDQGLAIFDPIRKIFIKVAHADGYSNDNIFDIKQFDRELLWVASDMGGISLVDLHQFGGNGILPNQHLTYIDNLPIRLSSINTRSVEQDEYGNIWIGNHSTGIDFISANNSVFNILGYNGKHGINNRTYGITSDKKGNVWLGGEDELVLFKDNTFVRSWNIDRGRHRKHSFSMCLLADTKGYIWLGMEDEGVIRFNTQTEQFERVEIGHTSSDIRSLYEDADGTIWIGSEFGVFKCKDGKVMKEGFLNNELSKEVVSSILRLPDNRLLLTTLGKGCFFVNTENGETTILDNRNGLPSNSVNHAIVDSRKGLWIATRQGLVNIPQITNLRQMYVYDSRQGLSDIHVRAIRQDESGRIWLSTFTGISCFDPQKERFYNYDHRNNLPSGSFISGSVCGLSDGTIYFGSPNGVCYFQPQFLNNDLKVSDVELVSCEAYNPAGEDTEILNLRPDDDNRVYTNYRQNTLRLTFKVKNYAEINNVEYSYMMKGLNNQWYYIGSDYDVVFRGLQPGNYTFILRAKLKNQEWDEASVTQLDIRIAPPFWRTWWAYLVYMIVIVTTVWYLIRNYKHKLILENSLELEQRESLQKQELNEERLRFFTNVTHELRTPLTLILGPLEDLVSDKRLPEVYHKKVELINKSAGRLHDLINQILEFRKTETQNRHLTVAKGDLGALVKEIGQHFKQLNRNLNVQVRINIQQDIPPVYFDSEVITTILTNLLSNAVKYTPKGSINLIMNTDGKGSVCISVADTGYGIAPDALPHIFDRYYQAKGKHQASGTGIGLALVKSLTDLHEGTLTVESEPGKGSTFTFALSMDNRYPRALHKEDKDSEEVKSEQDVVAEEEGSANADEVRPLLLVVEDNDDIRQYIADSMGDDYRILLAADGQQGKALAIDQVPDIIVSDIMMPKMDGIEMTRNLKDDVRTSHIPIILLTAKDSMEDKEEGYDSGADSYLTKPFSARLLQSRIQNLLSTRRKLAELITFKNTGSSGQASAPTDVEEPRMNRLDREFIDKLNKVIEDNITKEDLNMEFMSDNMAMSHSTFYRKVKALTGMSAKEYIRKKRLMRCAQLLKSGDYNVTEAATMIGFNDLGHFREIFKKEFGVPPSEYLRNKTATIL